MPNTRSIQFSFSGGEISPDMYGRVDQKSFQTGLKKCKNAVVRPQGPIKRRPGLEYCAESLDSTTPSRLIPLKTDPQTVMEVNTNKIRFFRNGGPLLASDINENVPYGTVRTYNGPQTITVTQGNPGLFTTSTPHNFTTGDRVVFSWGRTDMWPTANTTQMLHGFYYAADQGNLAGRLVHAPNERSYYIEGGTGLVTTGSIIRRGEALNDAGAGIPGSYNQINEALYADVSITGNIKLSYAHSSAFGAGGLNNLPIRRQGPEILETLGSGGSIWAYRFFRWTACFSHVGRPDSQYHAYGSQTQYYYVTVVNSTQFHVSLSVGGPLLPIYSLAGSTFPLQHYVMRVYLQGDWLKFPGSNSYQYVKTPFYAQATTNVAATYAANVSNAGVSGQLIIPYPYTLSTQTLQELNYAISNDVTTFTHRSAPAVDIYRYSDRWWSFTTSLNLPAVASPGQQLFKRTYGPQWAASSGLIINSNRIVGESIIPFVRGDLLVRGFYTSTNPYENQPIVGIRFIDTQILNNNKLVGLTLAYTDNTPYIPTNTDVLAGVFWELVPSTDWETLNHTYQVTAIDGSGVESLFGPSVICGHNLSNRGSNLIVTWQPTPAAQKYRVYKLVNGQFGWIGDVPSSFFIDENYDVDLAQKPPFYDYSFTSSQQAVAYFEQRRVYGGATASPAKLWMTQSNTIYDFSYNIPSKDTDRIVVQMAARQNERIRHILTLSDLMVLTDQGEWQVSPVNSDVITPNTISVRKQSSFGANFAVPVTLGTSAVYVTARGGHARELSYSQDSRGYVTGDLSLRAAHLFDGKDMVDIACMRAPFPVLWFVSTDGLLKSLTYIPEEKIYAWHEHETDGVFESVAVITEGLSDVLYASVRRTINGVTKRYVERMAPLQEYGDNNIYLDSSLSGDGTNATATTMTLTDTLYRGWGVGTLVTASRSAGTFVTTDVNDYLVLIDAAGNKYRAEVLAVGSPATTATVRLLDVVPESLRGVATTSWAFARNQWSGLSHLEGKTVSIWADGVMQASKVVSGGSVTIDTPAIKVRIGLPYTTTVETLPIALQADAFGQGRTKNVNKVWVRMQGTQEFQIGPTTSDLVSSGTLPSGQTDGELQVTLLPAWSQDGSIVMQQSDAFPMNINGLTLEAAIGS